MCDRCRWLNPRKKSTKPEDGETYLTKNYDHRLVVAQYDEDDNMWRTDDWQIVDVWKYMIIPDDEDG